MSNTDHFLALRWFAWQPTPYNDVLFRALASDPDLDLLVHFRNGVKATHPWQTPLRNGYSSTLYCGRGARLDPRCVTWAVRDTRIWLTAGWPGATIKLALVLLAAKQRRFVFWTDTPQVKNLSGDGPCSGIVEMKTLDAPYPKYQARLRHMLYKLVFKSAAAVMSTGKPGVNALLALGCPKSKVVNMPFFVDLPPQSAREHFFTCRGSDRVYRIFASGQLTRRKGYDLVVEALKVVAAGSRRKFEVTIAGDGPDRALLQAQAEAGGLGRRIKFLGWAEPKTVQELMLSADCFVHPARMDPFPVAVLEAMACGVPVVGSITSGSVVDRVVHGRNGFIHQQGDVRQISDHLLALIESPSLSEEMGRAARKTAEEWPVTRGVSIVKEACRRCL